MDTIRFFEIQSAIDCGKFECLRGCCDQLPAIAALLRGLSERDLALVGRMLCPCPVTPGSGVPQIGAGGGASATGGTCGQRMSAWARNNQPVLTALQLGLTALGGLSLPAGWDQAIAAAQAVVEDLEDAATAGETGVAGDAVDSLCAGVRWLRDFGNSVVNVLPSAMQGVREPFAALGSLFNLSDSCCGAAPGTTPALPPAQNTTPGGVPNAPALPSGQPTSATPVTYTPPQPASATPVTRSSNTNQTEPLPIIGSSTRY